MAGPRIKVITIPATDAEFDASSLRRDLTRVVTNVAFDGVRFIARYPPQSLTASGYVRTGTLARSWSARVRTAGDDLEGRVGSAGNIAPYNIHVQGEKPVPIFPNAGWRGVDELNDFLQTRGDRGVDEALERATR